MNIGIIGAGFCGLALTWHLTKLSCRVTVFDEKGIGEAASGISSGLLHRYPGQEMRPSWRGEEGIEASKELLDISGKPYKEGIYRYTHRDSKFGNFANPRASIFCSSKQALSAGNRADAEERKIEDSGAGKNPKFELSCVYSLFFKDGLTVFPKRYLKGLWDACEKKRAVWVRKKISNWEELMQFDRIVFAGGAGARHFPLCRDLPLQYIKGQVLKCRIKEKLAHSVIGKGHIAVTEEEKIVLIGSTYEREFKDAMPDLEIAKREIFSRLYPPILDVEVLDCYAGIRVMRKGHYYPIVDKIGEKRYFMGAMGSRGLLYHALLAKELADAIYYEDMTKISNNVRINT